MFPMFHLFEGGWPAGVARARVLVEEQTRKAGGDDAAVRGVLAIYDAAVLQEERAMGRA
jgi:hypothetical protein